MVAGNLKSGGTKACFYDPQINRTYADLGGALRHGRGAGAASQPKE